MEYRGFPPQDFVKKLIEMELPSGPVTLKDFSGLIEVNVNTYNLL